MKAILLILMVITTATANYPKTCVSNAFVDARKQYVERPLETLSAPLPANSLAEFANTCGGEWAKFGVCCDPWKLSDHIQRNDRVMNDTVNNLIQIVIYSVNPTTQLFLRLKQLTLAAPNSLYPQWGINIAFARSFLENVTNLVAFKEFNNTLSSEYKSAFKSETLKCWSHMIKLRTSSLCQACSARSHVFFKDNKGLVSTETCVSSIRHCFSALKMTLKFIKLAKWLIDTFEKLKDHSIDTKAMSIGRNPDLKEVADSVSKIPIYHLIETYNLTQAENSTIAGEICHEYFNLAKPTYLQTMVYRVLSNPITLPTFGLNCTQPIQASASKIKAEMPALELKLQTILGNYEASLKTSTSRLLQTLPIDPLVSVFSSDSLVVNNEDSILSFIASIPREDSYTGPYERLNLTLTFP